MPSASTTLCEQCEVHAAKYTCPACKLRTCSLACTKAHKDVATAKRACSASATASASTTPSSSSIARDAVPQTASSGNIATTSAAGAPMTFVPLSAYGESHMLQDYLFLSAISRTTAENGRRIMSLNLLPPSSSSDTSHKGGNMGAGRQTNQQRQREQLLKQLHYRRFRVMVLPDGMARRRANQSQFSPKDKKMHLSVELTLPAHLSKAAVGTQDQPGETARGWMLHKQDSLKSVQDVVLGELQHRSFANKKELLKAKELFNTPGLHTTNSSSSSSISSKDKTTATPTMWILSTRLLDDTRLPLPARATITDDWVALYAWPAEWSVVVPCYSARLTNESTARYLEWWTRKRKWEEANPELAALQQRNDAAARRSAGSEGGGDGEGDGGAEGKRERGWSRAVEEDQEESTPAAPVAAVEDAGAAVVAEGGAMGGIVSSSLLSMLSERLGRTPQSTSTSHAPPPSPHDQPSTTNTSTTTATEASSTTTAHSSESKISAADSASARSVRVHVVSPAGTSLAWLLQTLPEGYSVVEFAELRVVAAASLSNDEVVPLLPERTVQPAKPEGEDEVKVETKAPPTTGTQGSLGGLLAGYASDSDDDEDADDNKGDAEPTQPNVSAGDGPTANADEEPRGSLASLAALHGFLTPS